LYNKIEFGVACSGMKKIVIIGPESTGKSTLCEQLALHFNTQWCKEYAREYLLQYGMQYSYDNLLAIAEGQLNNEDALTATLLQQNASLMFIDTDMYVMKVWCEYVFDKCHQFILDAIAERKYDLYLLCNIDLPWIKDELREYPDEAPRKELYGIYKDILINQATPWIEISGSYDERLQKAIDAVNDLNNQS
jgi:NadR type nicotinamide-nucleotide adenylyltransferase